VKNTLILVAVIALMGFVGHMDAQDEITTKVEQDAYERYMDVQAEARYRLTDQPINASTLEVTITVCHQYPSINHRWQCWGVK
jgi:hypothetical protein